MQMSTYALLSQHGHLRQMSDREVHIGIVNQTLLNLTKNNQAKIEAAFSQVLGRRIKVAFEIAPLPHKTTPAPKAKEPPHSAVVIPSQPREELPPPPIEPTPTPPPPPLTTDPILCVNLPKNWHDSLTGWLFAYPMREKVQTPQLLKRLKRMSLSFKGCRGLGLIEGLSNAKMQLNFWL